MANTETNTTSNTISTFQKTNQSLQELLHTLLTRLSDSSEIIKSWPENEGGDNDNSIHTETTTKLITSINKVVDAIRLVEERVNPNIGDENEKEETDEKPSASSLSSSDQEFALANQLRQTAIPLDLLDMMDANSLNPDCFSRGLINEALRQFSNLRQRKASMNMLAQMVESGFEQRELKQMEIPGGKREEDESIGVCPGINNGSDSLEHNTTKKRKRDSSDTNDSNNQEDDIILPSEKKEKIIN